MKNNTLITIAAILIAVGGFLQTLQEPAWLNIVGGVILTVGGVFGGTGGNSKYRKYKKRYNRQYN